MQFSRAYCKLLLTFYCVNCYRAQLDHLSSLLFTNDICLIYCSGGNGYGSDPDLTVLSRIRIGSGSSFIRRCGSGPDLDLNLASPPPPPQIIWGQNQTYIPPRPFFFLSPPEFWQKKCPDFQLRL